MFDWRRFLTKASSLTGLMIVLAFVFLALAAPWLAPQDDPQNPTAFKIFGGKFDRLPNSPTTEHPLGTVPRRYDVVLLGTSRAQAEVPQLDIYYTFIWGTRSALRFGLVVTIATALFGLFVGLISGYFGGLVEGVAMRVTDAFLAFPAIAAVWLFDRAFFSTVSRIPSMAVGTVELRPIEAIVHGLGLTPVMLALIAFSWMPYARIINALARQLRHAEFVTAARSLGAGHRRILLRHLLPNVVAPAIVLAARDVGGMVILESAFAFIGLQASAAWGVMLAASRDYVIGLGGNPLVYWWTFLPITVALVLFGVGWNLLGDGLNDALNPYGR